MVKDVAMYSSTPTKAYRYCRLCSACNIYKQPL